MDEDEVFFLFEAADASERELSAAEELHMKQGFGSVESAATVPVVVAAAPPPLATDCAVAEATEALAGLRPADYSERRLLTYEHESLLHFLVFQRDSAVCNLLAAFTRHGNRPQLVAQLNAHFARQSQFQRSRWETHGWSGSSDGAVANEYARMVLNERNIIPVNCLNPILGCDPVGREWVVKVRLTSVGPIQAYAGSASSDGQPATVQSAADQGYGPGALAAGYGWNRAVKPGGQYVVANLVDGLGDAIRMVLFNKALAKFYPVLHPGRVYYIGSGKVTVWRSRGSSPATYRTTAPQQQVTRQSPYTIVLNCSSLLVLSPLGVSLKVKAQLPQSLSSV